MKFWLFQGNPNLFDLRGYVESADMIAWSVRQKHFASQILPGDTVFIWMAKGSGSESGVIAQCRVSEAPREMEDPVDSLPFWRKPNAVSKGLRVRLQIEKRCLGKKEIIKANWFEEDPILTGHRIFKMRSETNYSLSVPEGERLTRLVENTGKNWTRADTIAGLWAFAQTYGGVLSTKKESPVANVALLIGRAVSGVYNKVLNFRAIDPRDPRSGFSGGGETVKVVWAEFYDQESQTLRETLLGEAFAALFGGDRDSARAIKTYEDFGDAPNDDPEELSRFALRVRRGQPKFRKNLLKFYGGRCAISGWQPEAVLEAAHIQPHAKKGVNKSENGILLRSDLHALFDSSLIRIHPRSLKVEIAEDLVGTPYELYSGKVLREREDGKRPSEVFLRERYERNSGNKGG